MSLKDEQLEPDGKDSWKNRRKLLKKGITRLERRAAKKDPEDAPKKRKFKGYNT
jgi:hypothetical protein